VHRRLFRPVLSWLEARVLLSGNPTYYTVNLTSDTGASSGTDATTGDPSGDLLCAIEQANANSNPCGSVINFNVCGPGPRRAPLSTRFSVCFLTPIRATR